MARRAHFVGSLGLEDAETAMSSVATILGDCCSRIPDGETGERGYWVRWQVATFENCDSLELEVVRETFEGYKDNLKRPFYVIKAGIDPATIDLGELGYGDEAIASYATFKELKASGEISADVRFQVSIPTPMALLLSFVSPKSQLALEPAVIQAFKRDLNKIQTTIPLDELAIQFDVCLEVLGYEGAMELPFDDVINESVKRVGELGGEIGRAAEFGIHLCYGDPGHQHVVEPKDLDTSVKFANGIVDATSRAVNFMHMPVPKDRNDEAYFAPLKDLSMPAETRLILGLVHHTDGVEGGKARIATAEKFVQDFDIATECGFGRRDPGTISALLQIHRELCD